MCNVYNVFTLVRKIKGLLISSGCEGEVSHFVLFTKGMGPPPAI